MRASEIRRKPTYIPPHPPPPPPRAINEERLHHYLWRRSGPGNRIVMTSERLANLLHVYPLTAWKVLRRMTEDGRLTVTGTRHGRRVFRVTDPEQWTPPGDPP